MVSVPVTDGHGVDRVGEGAYGAGESPDVRTQALRLLYTLRGVGCRSDELMQPSQRRESIRTPKIPPSRRAGMTKRSNRVRLPTLSPTGVFSSASTKIIPHVIIH